VDLGGLTATLFCLGLRHAEDNFLVDTPHSLKVEKSVHPSFEDSYLEDWADALSHIAALRHRYEYLVPGHGHLYID
jgi:hypothetical protein